MVDINLAFCRAGLKQVHADVKKALPSINPWTAVSTYRFLRTDSWEAQGTIRGQDLYWHGRADNAYDARAKAWGQFIRDLGLTIPEHEGA